MRLYIFWLALAPALPACAPPVKCGAGTEAKFDPASGQTVCTGKIPQSFVQCDPATASVVGGVCTGDDKKFPKCGDGTMLDQASNTCVPTANPGPTPKPCPPQMGKLAIKGTIAHLRDGKFTEGEMVEVRVYDPLAFLFNPMGTTPQKTQMSTDATYCFDDLVDQSGMGLIALAFTDPGGVNWLLGGVGLDNIAPGNSYRLDGFVVEKSLAASWDMMAGLAPPNTFAEKGAYVARFVDKPRNMDAGARPVAGVKLQMGGADAPDVFHFKNDLGTIDRMLAATEATTGAVVQRVTPANLTTYSGKGGTIGGMPVAKWASVPGASTGGVVFITKFHPEM